MTNSSHPGQRLREQRIALGWTQDEAASKVGVSREMWGKYERDKAKPGGDILSKMGQAGIDVAYVLTGQTLAVREAFNRVKVATGAAAMIGGTREEVLEYQERIVEVLRAQDEDESGLLSDYRRCKPPDKQVIRQMASRLAATGSTDEPQGRKKKRR